MHKRKIEALHIQKCLDLTFTFDQWFIRVYYFKLDIIFPQNFEGISPFSARFLCDANLIFYLLLINCFSSLKACVYSLILGAVKFLQDCTFL